MVSCIKKVAKWSRVFATPLYGGLVVYIHEALKQLPSITKKLGEHCVTFAWRLSCGYSRGTKAISKLHLPMETLKSLANKTVKRSHYMK